MTYTRISFQYVKKAELYGEEEKYLLGGVPLSDLFVPVKDFQSFRLDRISRKDYNKMKNSPMNFFDKLFQYEELLAILGIINRTFTNV